MTDPIAEPLAEPLATPLGTAWKAAPAGLHLKALEFKPTHVHLKTAKEYQVLGEVIDATNAYTIQRRLKVGPEYLAKALEAHKILYRNEDGHLFVRDMEEFHDGRFKEIEDEPVA